MADLLGNLQRCPDVCNLRRVEKYYQDSRALLEDVQCTRREYPAHFRRVRAIISSSPSIYGTLSASFPEGQLNAALSLYHNAAHDQVETFAHILQSLPYEMRLFTEGMIKYGYYSHLPLVHLLAMKDSSGAMIELVIKKITENGNDISLCYNQIVRHPHTKARLHPLCLALHHNNQPLLARLASS